MTHNLLNVVFSVGCIIFALLAAMAWGMSASVSIPTFDNSWVEMVGVKEFIAALKRVARLNALASSAAFVSAALQGVTFYLTLR